MKEETSGHDDRKCVGFTLVELMVVLLLFSVLSAALFSVFSVGYSSWYSAGAQITLQQELRKAMEQISNDLRQTSTTQLSLADGSTAANFSFNISQGAYSNGSTNWSSPIVYSWSGANFSRTAASVTRRVANYVTGVSFSRVAKIIMINLSVQETAPNGRIFSANTTSRVSLRN